MSTHTSNLYRVTVRVDALDFSWDAGVIEAPRPGLAQTHAIAAMLRTPGVKPDGFSGSHVDYDIEPVTRYQRAYDYADAYTDEAWGNASGHAWDRLAAIAGEYERGERDWDSARALIDDTRAEIAAAAND